MADKQLDAAQDAHAAIVRRTVKEGDLLTHKRCMGCLEEHTFVGWDGPWLSGRATSTTVRLGGYRGVTSDIAPCNVTHINRVPVEAVEFLAEVAGSRMVHSASGARTGKSRSSDSIKLATR